MTTAKRELHVSWARRHQTKARNEARAIESRLHFLFSFHFSFHFLDAKPPRSKAVLRRSLRTRRAVQMASASLLVGLVNKLPRLQRSCSRGNREGRVGEVEAMDEGGV